MGKDTSIEEFVHIFELLQILLLEKTGFIAYKSSGSMIILRFFMALGINLRWDVHCKLNCKIQIK